MKRFLLLLFVLPLAVCPTLMAQEPVAVGSGSYASFVPLRESKTDSHGGCQAYQMEHRRIYVPDSLVGRPLPSNDWWTYGLVNAWTGKLWTYPGWVEAKNSSIEVGFPDHWSSDGCEVKWNDVLHIELPGLDAEEKLIDSWSDFAMSFIMENGDKRVRVTCVQGSPLTWIELTHIQPVITNPDPTRYTTFTHTEGNHTLLTIGLVGAGLSREQMAPYATRIPHRTTVSYSYDAAHSTLHTSLSADVEMLLGMLPHHYQNTTLHFALGADHYLTPRGAMRMAQGRQFDIDYTVHGMLPFFPLPDKDLPGYSESRMQQLCADYAARGSFGADTYWGGKGLTQMMHYMTAALQMGDTATFRKAKDRLRETLVNWYTYTPGETEFYFARYDRWGALVGFDVSYDSDTFNDHHFHYGYFIYASAVLCMLDDDFRRDYGPMAREVARDYANWIRPEQGGDELPEPWFRMFNPYCGHSLAGGMGNGGNGNGQESTSEAMQSWGGLWMLGAALGDQDMLEAGIFGYTLESRATAEYWFDRGRRNINYDLYKHPWCCNLTFQGVGWWTWFSGDPVWMHSIQWLPISPVLQNYLSEDRDFARWDYTEMYTHKEVGNYEAAQGGLGDESGLGNVCLSYLALFDPDSAARVWDRMDRMGKNLAKNPDTGGITYMLAHGLRRYGHHDHSILSDCPTAVAYTTEAGETTYGVYNTTSSPRTVTYSNGIRVTAPADALTLFRADGSVLSTTRPIADDKTPKPTDPIADRWHHSYPNVALRKSVSCSSYENAGCVPVNLTDGDVTTRWGSQHYDNEWAIVDLGSLHYIDHITLRWEAAYASRYELAFSADRQNWATLTYSGSGGVETRQVSGDLLQQGDSARCRYIRITGLERATPYGTSLYELEAYGLPISGDATRPVALEILSDQVSLRPGQTPEFTVHAYNYLGQEMTASPTIQSEADDYTYTVTATWQGLKATYTWPILEQVETSAARLTPREVTMALGETQVFTISTVDQFGYTVRSERRYYTATEVGDFRQIYTLDGLNDTASIHVVAYSDLNLALNKTATCSGSENDGTGADRAVDGKLDTRWSSRFQDDEWIMVDLGDLYSVNRVKLHWENAYATSYEVLLSTDRENWTQAYSTTNNNGGVKDHNLSETPTRYVKVLCHKRNTGYGSSLWELEVYGTGRITTLLPTPNMPSSDHQTADKEIVNGQLLIRTNSRTYHVLGN